MSSKASMPPKASAFAKTSISSQSLLKIVALAIWLGLSYGLRFYLMENLRWVEICGHPDANIACSVRAGVGMTIHFGVLAWVALLTALPAFFMAGKRGRALAWFSLIFALPALALYTVTPAVFAVLLAALRLVRNERHNANASTAETRAQPSA